MKRTRKDLNEAELACLSVFENNSRNHLAPKEMPIAWLVGEKLSKEIKPETLEEAVNRTWEVSNGMLKSYDIFWMGAKQGAKWQKENEE